VLSDGSVPVAGSAGDAGTVGTIAEAPVSELWPQVLRGRGHGTDDP